nr:MAG TPA: hypothetical protein [Caudoviricetes sp.]
MFPLFLKYVLKFFAYLDFQKRMWYSSRERREQRCH